MLLYIRSKGRFLSMEAFQALGFLVLLIHEQCLQLLDGGSLVGVDFEHAGEDSLKARGA